MSLTQMLHRERRDRGRRHRCASSRPDRYYVVSAAATETHDLGWLQLHCARRRLRPHRQRHGALRRAHDRGAAIARAAPARVGATTSPMPASRSSARATVEVGRAQALAARVSYVGELGWELHHPIEVQRRLYDALFDGRRGPRPRRLRLPGPRVDATREVLPALGRRHVRRLRRPSRRGWSGSSPSTRATSSAATPFCASASGAQRTCSPASSSTPTASMLTARACLRGWRAPDRLRRLGRLRPHDRAVDRPRLPPGRARRGRAGADGRHPRRAPPCCRLRAAAARPVRRTPLPRRIDARKARQHVPVGARRRLTCRSDANRRSRPDARSRPSGRCATVSLELTR